MKKRIFIVLFLLLFVGMWLWLHNRLPEHVTTDSPGGETSHPVLTSQARPGRTTPATAPNKPGQNAPAVVESRINQIKSEVEKGHEEWRTPIDFYGQVVDENTNPVANADVLFTWTDLSPKGNSEKNTTSDSSGSFFLRNEAGKHLMVQVSKQGYYAYQPFGAGFFYAGENQNFVPDAANPVIFRLKKKGVAESLVHVQAPMGGAKGFKISKDGTALEISLLTGTTVPLGQGDLQVQCWTDDRGKASGEKYDWKCQVSVPNGGLLQSTNDLDFQAPLVGYQSSDMIDMPAALENDWSSHASRNYFLKLANGNYARINFTMVAGGDHFFQLESFLNPSGSRNLEFDPQMAVNP